MERLKDLENIPLEKLSDLKKLLIPVLRHNQLLTHEYAKMEARMEAAEAAQDALAIAHQGEVTVERFASMSPEDQLEYEDARVPGADEPYPEDEVSLSSKLFRYCE